MRFLLSVFLFTLALTWPGAIIPGDVPTHASIEATATVAHPIGLVQLKADSEILETPLLTEYANRWFLYVPNTRASVLLDGVPLEIDRNDTTGLLSVLDLTAYVDSRRADRPLVITIIQTAD